MTYKQLYAEYLKSDHWRKLRAEAFRVYPRICSYCPQARDLEPHHVTYRYPWTLSTVADLCLACPVCHKKQHGILIKAVRKFDKSRRFDPVWKKKAQAASVIMSARPGNSHFLIFPPKGRVNSLGQLDPASKASMCNRMGAQGTGQQQSTEVGESNTPPTASTISLKQAIP